MSLTCAFLLSAFLARGTAFQPHSRRCWPPLPSRRSISWRRIQVWSSEPRTPGTAVTSARLLACSQRSSLEGKCFPPRAVPPRGAARHSQGEWRCRPHAASGIRVELPPAQEASQSRSRAGSQDGQQSQEEGRLWASRHWRS